MQDFPSPRVACFALYIDTKVLLQWRGFVSNEHPSEVMPLQWPEVTGGSLAGTNHPAIQLGVSLESLGMPCAVYTTAIGILVTSENALMLPPAQSQLQPHPCAVHAEEVMQREGTKLASRQEFAKRVALDLFRFMESFNKGVQGDMLVLPTNCLELWFNKFDSKFRRQVGTAVSKPPLALLQHGS